MSVRFILNILFCAATLSGAMGITFASEERQSLWESQYHQKLWEDYLEKFTEVAPENMVGNSDEMTTQEKIERVIVSNAPCISGLEDGLKVLNRTYKYFVAEKKWAAVPPHLFFDQDGKVYQTGRAYEYCPAICRENNKGTIGIMLIGCMHKFSESELKTLYERKEEGVLEHRLDEMPVPMRESLSNFISYFCASFDLPLSRDSVLKMISEVSDRFPINPGNVVTKVFDELVSELEKEDSLYNTLKKDLAKKSSKV